MKLIYSEILDSAWKSIKDDLALTAGLSFVFFVALAVVSRLPVLNGVLAFPLLAGYCRCLLQIRKREIIGYTDFFWGFMDMNRLLHLVLMNILITVGGMIGLVLLVIPGIWWFIASGFSLQIFILKGKDSVESIKASMDLVKGRWWNIFGFVILMCLINLAGLICFFVGILVSMPVTTLALLIAVEKLSAFSPDQISNSNFKSEPQAPVETTITPQ